MKSVKFLTATLLSILICFSIFSNAQEKSKPNPKPKAGNDKFIPFDTTAIANITNVKGKSNHGEYKITIPQNDLNVEVDGFRIIPPMGLSTWVGFTPSPEGAMIMGDIVLTENDLKPVQTLVVEQGLTITAIHNHFVRNHPNVLYMHIGGIGKTDELAQKVRLVLDKIEQSRGHKPSENSVADVEYTIDNKKLDQILGTKGEMSKGVYKYTISRPDVQLKEHGITVTSFLGFNTWAAFQGSPEHAAVAGDFTMLENEVQPVIKTLIENGIEVVAVHNHMVHEQPKIFFLHYWGVGNAEQLAKGLKAALDRTGKQKENMSKMKM
jgi:uncharacterized protein DUF1259